MHRLVEVVRLHREGTSARKIARLMRMGRDTIRGYLSKLAEADLLEGAAEDLPDAGVIAEAIGLANACQDTNCEESVNSTADRWRASILAFVKKGVGPTAIHDHLRLHDPDYTASLSAVKRMCLRLKKERGPQPEDIAIPVVTLPGAIAQVDFGYVGMIYDQDRGAPRKAWVFVMTLGFSRRTFADIVYDQKIETWLSLHVAAFEHFGGVPEVIVPDNLKSAVIRCAFGVDVDPVLNRSYRELARFYGFQIDPTPPRSPEKKGKVERDVRYLKGNFFATWESVDLPTDRKALWRWLAEVADLRIHGTTRRRPIDLFEEEKEALGILPSRRWDIVLWKKVKLHRDSHCQVDGALYSAPWRFVGQELWVRVTRHEVEVFHEHESLCLHRRVVKGQRSTVDAHLPEKRVSQRHRSTEYWLTKARMIGPEALRLAEEIFASDDVLSQLRRVQAVITLLEKFPLDRARRTAARALHFQSLSYGSIKNILTRGLDFEPLPTSEQKAWSEGSVFARDPREFRKE